MVTQITPIRTPPTPADTPAVFEERASNVWADLYTAVPQMNAQAQENNQAAADAEAAKLRAISEADLALGYRNEARGARDAAQGHASAASTDRGLAQNAKTAAEEARDDAEAFADRMTMPRFSAYVWTGPNTPDGDVPSSGQQLTDLMYPTMRADVVASQFYTTEADWQANPYKRVTHWSLGDGTTTSGSWMRPPDKNGVQAGNVGAFYASGSAPSGTKVGTAVGDAIRNIRGTVTPSPSSNLNSGAWGAQGFSGAFSAMGTSNHASAAVGTVSGTWGIGFDASTVVPTADENRPRTWYGIWCIRMYGRVTNASALDAPALSGRVDLIDSRVVTLEERPRALGDGQARTMVTRYADTVYPNETGRAILITVWATTTAAQGSVRLSIRRAGGTTFFPVAISIAPATSTSVAVSTVVLPGEAWSFTAYSVNSPTVYEAS